MASKLNCTPTDGKWGFPSIPDKYNVFSQVSGGKNAEKNTITLKVFRHSGIQTDIVHHGKLDKSEDICEQISQVVYVEDWETVEVVGGHSDRVGIDLRTVELIKNALTTNPILHAMRAFKLKFNADCKKRIAELQKRDRNVCLEVTKRFVKAKQTEEEADKTFKTIDSDHNRFISMPEYYKALRPGFSPRVAEKLGLDVVRGQESNARAVAQIRFDNIDTNQDKKLSWDEFRIFYGALPDALVDEKHDLWNSVLREK
jgi:Ca2+-binding EF-hand superfamily protein